MSSQAHSSTNEGLSRALPQHAKGLPLQCLRMLIVVSKCAIGIRCGVADSVSDDGLQCATVVSNLEELTLKCCSDVSLSTAAQLSRLQHLRCISLNGCRGVGDDALQAVALLPKLTHLDLEGCTSIGSAGLQHLARCYSLRHINVCGCINVSEVGVRCLPLPRSQQDAMLRTCWLSSSIWGAEVSPICFLAESGDVDAIESSCLLPKVRTSTNRMPMAVAKRLCVVRPAKVTRMLSCCYRLSGLM